MRVADYWIIYKKVLPKLFGATNGCKMVAKSGILYFQKLDFEDLSGLLFYNTAYRFN